MNHLARVKDIMSRRMVVVDPMDTVGKALRLMQQRRIHHLPVVAGGSLVGLVTHHDLSRAWLAFIKRMVPWDDCSFQRTMTVRQVMQPHVRTVGPDELASKAARLLRDRKIGCLPVIDDGLLVGMLTRSDFLDLAIHHLDSPLLSPNEARQGDRRRAQRRATIRPVEM